MRRLPAVALVAVTALLLCVAGPALGRESSEEEAVKLALAAPGVREELAGRGPRQTEAGYESGEWTVRFYVRGEGLVGGRPVGGGMKEVARVGVDDRTWEVLYAWTGDEISWLQARGERGAYGKQANFWWVWGPLALAFAVAFARNDRLFSLRNLDVAALLFFLVSHHFFRRGEVFPAVVLWQFPLVYLFVRTLLMGFGVGERVEKTSHLPAWLLFALAALASAVLVALNLDSRVIDVGYAGVVGADRILSGEIPYGNMPEEVANGDTYGPLNYLLYVPFVLAFGFSGEWGYLPAAHAATLFGFAVGAGALFLAGRRLAGTGGGAAMLLAWAAFPYTVYATNNNTNDVLVAAVAAVGLAVVSSPLGRGMSVVAGFAIKLYPLLLAPLWALHDGPRRSPILDFVLGGLGVGLLSFWVLFLDGRPLEATGLFLDRTAGAQTNRETPWTIFTQVPVLAPLQLPMLTAVLLLAFVVAVWPRKRTVRRLAAFSAALVVGFQLTLDYWFYPYVIWFEPFVFVALLLGTERKTPLDGSGGDAESGTSVRET